MEDKIKKQFDFENGPDANDFNDFLLARSINQKECAEKLHISERTVSRWISGESEVPYATWRLLGYEYGEISDHENYIKRVSNLLNTDIYNLLLHHKIVEKDNIEKKESKKANIVLYHSSMHRYIYKINWIDEENLVIGINGDLFTMNIENGIKKVKEVLEANLFTLLKRKSILIGNDGEFMIMNEFLY